MITPERLEELRQEYIERLRIMTRAINDLGRAEEHAANERRRVGLLDQRVRLAWDRFLAAMLHRGGTTEDAQKALLFEDHPAESLVEDEPNAP